MRIQTFEEKPQGKVSMQPVHSDEVMVNSPNECIHAPPLLLSECSIRGLESKPREIRIQSIADRIARRRLLVRAMMNCHHRIQFLLPFSYDLTLLKCSLTLTVRLSWFESIRFDWIWSGRIVRWLIFVRRRWRIPPIASIHCNHAFHLYGIFRSLFDSLFPCRGFVWFVSSTVSTV